MREIRNPKGSRYLPVPPRKRGSVEPVNVLEITRWIARIAKPPVPTTFRIPFPTFSPSRSPPPSFSCLSPSPHLYLLLLLFLLLFLHIVLLLILLLLLVLLLHLLLLLRGRPVALIIREYVAVMLSIPPANSNRAHPPTWWVPAGKVAARLAIPAFLCWLWPWTGLKSKGTRESERKREREREKEIRLRQRERAALRVPLDFPACEIRHVLPQVLPWFPVLVAARVHRNRGSRYVIQRKDLLPSTRASGPYSGAIAVPSSPRGCVRPLARQNLSPRCAGWWTVHQTARTNQWNRQVFRTRRACRDDGLREMDGQSRSSFPVPLSERVYGVDVAQDVPASGGTRIKTRDDPSLARLLVAWTASPDYRIVNRDVRRYKSPSFRRGAFTERTAVVSVIRLRERWDRRSDQG